jgi:hypothetical protein
MWYVLILISILLMIISYRGTKAFRRRPPNAPKRKPGLLATDTATISIATIILVFVALIVLSSTPNPKVYKTANQEDEVVYLSSMAERLATELRAVKRDGRKALVITYRPNGNLDIAHKHHAALIEGLEAGFGDSVEIAETVVEVAEMESEEDDEKLASKNFYIPQSKFTEILKAHANYHYLVCFAGIPERYNESTAALKAAKSPPELAVGILTDNIYMQGETIYKKEISVCVIPKRASDFHQDEPAEDDVQANFDTRYLMVTPDSLAKFGRDNPRMIKRYRAW